MQRLGLALLAVACLMTADAFAQSGSRGLRRSSAPRTVPRYQPATPTTSRYLNLFAGAGGTVGNYYGIIRPQERAQAQLAQQQREQRTLLESRVAELEQEQVMPTGKQAWFTIPSQRNTFRDTSHYYFRWDDRRLPTSGQRR